MRVRCSFCGAEYEAAVTRAALLLVARCEQCGRARLRSVDADVTGGEPDDARTDFCDSGDPGALA